MPTRCATKAKPHISAVKNKSADDFNSLLLMAYHLTMRFLRWNFSKPAFRCLKNGLEIAACAQAGLDAAAPAVLSGGAATGCLRPAYYSILKMKCPVWRFIGFIWQNTSGYARGKRLWAAWRKPKSVRKFLGKTLSARVMQPLFLFDTRLYA
jgi:hypothetical protein